MQNMIRTACPQCGTSYDVDGQYEGAEVQCENCGRQFFVVCDETRRGTRRKSRSRQPKCFPIWLAFFAVQGCGYLLAWLVNMVIDSALITFMVDYSVGFDLLKIFITLTFTAMASYFAFKFIVVKKVDKRIDAEKNNDNRMS